MYKKRNNTEKYKNVKKIFNKNKSYYSAQEPRR